MKSVLFICTGNSARSIVAEALLNERGAGRFCAFSAGSHPAGAVNTSAIALLESNGLSVRGLWSKSWDHFSGPGAPAMDIVITVCDNAASEPCPIWPLGPARAHWGLADPAAIAGEEASKTAFETTFGELERRILILLALPIEDLKRAELEARLDEIGGAKK